MPPQSHLYNFNDESNWFLDTTATKNMGKVAVC